MYLLRGMSPRVLSIIFLRLLGIQIPIVTISLFVKIINPDNGLLAAEYLKKRKSAYGCLWCPLQECTGLRNSGYS